MRGIRCLASRVQQGRFHASLAVPRALLFALSALPAEPWVITQSPGAVKGVLLSRPHASERQRSAGAPSLHGLGGVPCLEFRRMRWIKKAGASMLDRTGEGFSAGESRSLSQAPSGVAGGEKSADFGPVIREKGLSAFLYACHTMEPSWRGRMRSQFGEAYFFELAAALKEEVLVSKKTIFPSPTNIFTAFELTPFDSVRVVIVGQDPYHRVGQAEGLSFSVPHGVPPPPSLNNIFTELESDPHVQFRRPTHGHLGTWASQGVLLLNRYLTVREGEPLSHSKLGWKEFTDSAIRQLNAEKEGLIFALWGAPAQEVESLLTPGKQHVLKSSHPSPLSAYRTDSPFLGNRHFSKINEILRQLSQPEVDWQI